MSDSNGFIHDQDGIDLEKLQWVRELKFSKGGRISEYSNTYSFVKFYSDQRPWIIPGDMAFPCATQNEMDLNDAIALTDNNIIVVAEGANMPCTLEAVRYFQEKGVLFAPTKTANAGGTAISGLEQSQNSARLSWSREEMDGRLQEIISHIHEQCVEYGSSENGHVNYVNGAKISGFVKVADAMIAYGIA